MKQIGRKMYIDFGDYVVAIEKLPKVHPIDVGIQGAGDPDYTKRYGYSLYDIFDIFGERVERPVGGTLAGRMFGADLNMYAECGYWLTIEELKQKKKQKDYDKTNLLWGVEVRMNKLLVSNHKSLLEAARSIRENGLRHFDDIYPIMDCFLVYDKKHEVYRVFYDESEIEDWIGEYYYEDVVYGNKVGEEIENLIIWEYFDDETVEEQPYLKSECKKLMVRIDEKSFYRRKRTCTPEATILFKLDY